MLSIDEAILLEREAARRNKMILELNKLMQESHAVCCDKLKRETSIRIHEQLAEWLEDYKRIKMLIPIEQALKNEYNKAIDDLLEDANEMAIEVDVDTYTMKAIGIGLLENIAEQLKGRCKKWS